ncbi:MAG: RimJ/RimL family protein N-acetyltransferase [Flavobacteriales bacterium]|jgi:RimJ/RimL family protein N-acetyltransferase
MTTILLENERVKLIPLMPEHFDILLPLSTQVDLLKYGASDVSTPEKLRGYMNDAFAKAEQGRALPFLIYDKLQESYAGSTRFGNIDTRHKVVHIGWTWLGEAFRGSGLNTHMKFLMLSHVFEQTDMEKVAFRIDERNLRSRRAVEKIGGTLEGILKKNLIIKDGFRRSSACYGILKEEWPQLKSTVFKELH